MASLPEFSLSDQVVVVTGAGKGIGRGIALDASRAGASIAACSRTSSELDELREEILDLGGRCETMEVDLVADKGPERLHHWVFEQFGRIDAVVNNAGANILKDAVDYSSSEVDQLIAINLTAVYWSCVYAAKIMLSSGIRGSIVNVTSQAGVAGAPGRAPYSAAKAGVNHLTRSLAAEWATSCIRVNAVAPTVTATPLGLRALEQRPALAEEVRRRIPLKGGAADVKDITLPVIFLLSKAAQLITGQTLVVDGGWTL